MFRAFRRNAMNVVRFSRAAIVLLLAVVLGGTLASCKVDKAELARLVDLRNVDLSRVEDGVYEAAYTIDPPVMAANKTVKVRVTVAGGRYEAIEIMQPKIGEGAAFKTLLSRVKESQTLSMDAVSSATVTSTAILKAIQIAVSSPGN
jgi:uncharacterized protein with FMN-binding domain